MKEFSAKSGSTAKPMRPASPFSRVPTTGSFASCTAPGAVLDGRLGLRGRPRSAEPVDAEGGPGQLVILDADARLLAEDALHPWLATGVAERERDRLARHAGREIGHDRLPEPAAVIAGVAGHEHEHALVLEPRDAVGDRAEWQPIDAEPCRWLDREGERAHRT